MAPLDPPESAPAIKIAATSLSSTGRDRVCETQLGRWKLWRPPMIEKWSYSMFKMHMWSSILWFRFCIAHVHVIYITCTYTCACESITSLHVWLCYYVVYFVHKLHSLSKCRLNSVCKVTDLWPSLEIQIYIYITPQDAVKIVGVISVVWLM